MPNEPAMQGASKVLLSDARPGQATSNQLWLCALLVLLIGLHLATALGRGANWDEFWFYSQVEAVARGDDIPPLQTIHTRAFAWWLPNLPGNELNHIIIARLFMLGCLTLTAGAIYAGSRAIAEKPVSLLAAAAYLGAGFVLQHGTSFRVDPIVTAFLSVGLAIALRTRLSWPAVAALGLMIGCAAMVTIKFVLWGPAFAAVGLWHWHKQNWDWHYIARWFAAGTIAAVVFGLLFIAHSSAMPSELVSEQAAGTLSRSSGKMFGWLVSPYAYMLIKGAIIGAPFAIAAILVPLVMWQRKDGWVEKVLIAGMWLPVLTPLFYHNSAPYIYTFILPPVAIAATVSIGWLTTRYHRYLFAGSIALCALVIWATDPRGEQEKQNALIDGVHSIFPEPVNYIDCCGMMGSFNKSNGFLSAWGIERYQNLQSPALLEAMRTETIPLVVNNNGRFGPVIAGETDDFLHPNDAAALRDTYVQFWGDVYLAGRKVGSNQSIDWHILVPGPYTVSGALEIDGTLFTHGAIVELERGAVSLTNPDNSDARLIWGREISLPDSTPPEAYWAGF